MLWVIYHSFGLKNEHSRATLFVLQKDLRGPLVIGGKSSAVSKPHTAWLHIEFSSNHFYVYTAYYNWKIKMFLELITLFGYFFSHTADCAAVFIMHRVEHCIKKRPRETKPTNHDGNTGSVFSKQVVVDMIGNHSPAWKQWLWTSTRSTPVLKSFIL